MQFDVSYVDVAITENLNDESGWVIYLEHQR